MLTIAISDGLAGEHCGFLAAMAERGHTVDVFDAAGRVDQTTATTSKDREQRSSIPAVESCR